MILILAQNSWAQYDSIPSTLADVEDEELFEGVSYRGGFGLFIPSSNENFRIAPYFELNMNIPISERNSIEFAAQIGGWDRENNFNYIRRMDSLKATSRLLINGLFKFKKDVIFFRKSFISVGAGFGASIVNINTVAFIFDEILEETPYETMSSFLLSPELEYVFDISERTQFSLSFSMQYADYKLRSALQNDFGKWYYMPKVTYRF